MVWTGFTWGMIDTSGGGLRKGQDQWQGVTKRSDTNDGVLGTGQGPVTGCYEQVRYQWRGVTNRSDTSDGVLRTG